MTRDELQKKIDELMRQYSEEEIDSVSFSQKLLELTTSAQNDQEDD